MRLPILIAAFLLPVSDATLRADFYEASAGESPSHLVPVPPAAGDPYEALIHERLVAKWGSGAFGTMLVLPSFGPEYCVSLYAEGSQDQRTYVAIVSKASESLWTWMNRTARKEPVNEIHVAHKSRTVSLRLAAAIQRVFGRALQLTHYPTKAPPKEIDGVTYRFSVFVGGLGDLHGQCHSPLGGVAMDLTVFGHALRDFVEPSETAKALPEEQLIERLEKLEATIPKA